MFSSTGFTTSEPKKMVSSDGFATSYTNCYSTWGASSQRSPFLIQVRSTPDPTDLWHWVGSALLKLFVYLVSCYVCYYVLRNEPFRLSRAERRKSESLIADNHPALMHGLERSTERRALSSMFGFWVCAFAIHQIFLASLSSLGTTLYDDRGSTVLPVILLALYFVADRRLRISQQVSTIFQDEEAQGHGRKEPDWPTFPAIGKETSLAYVQKLKRRLRTYVYQQDN